MGRQFSLEKKQNNAPGHWRHDTLTLLAYSKYADQHVKKNIPVILS